MAVRGVSVVATRPSPMRAPSFRRQKTIVLIILHPNGRHMCRSRTIRNKRLADHHVGQAMRGEQPNWTQVEVNWGRGDNGTTPINEDEAHAPNC